MTRAYTKQKNTSHMKALIALLSLWLPVSAMANMIKIGSGEAYWGLIKLYDASFYVEEGAKPSSYLSDDVKAKLKLCYARKLSVKNFIDGANHALPNKLPAKLRTAVDKLHKSYRPVKKGDCYTLDYTPNVGTRLLLNDETLSVVNTAGFKRTYFGIWLGEKPLSLKLKNKLLGN